MRDYAEQMIKMAILTRKLHDAFLKNQRHDAVLLSSDIVDIASDIVDIAQDLEQSKVH
jgi:hypothetical protein